MFLIGLAPLYLRSPSFSCRAGLQSIEAIVGHLLHKKAPAQGKLIVVEERSHHTRAQALPATPRPGYRISRLEGILRKSPTRSIRIGRRDFKRESRPYSTAPR